ncbi:HIT domain-containing protein [Nocardia suismassiliense]|uniref:HIT domain-containing protein n=1 Tax=Nocardia suismassiliense TaxID=2077092 RepID=UPI000D1F8ACC|nr:HIT domain-containing protein [Nocardia suismassiliense]
MGNECLICDKHQGVGRLVGPVIYTNDLVAVTHRPLSEGSPMPGYLFVETVRHAATLADLSDAEAAAVGWAVRRAAAALRTELAPDFVFSAIAGRSVAHFHQHVFVRPQGTPDAVGWFDSDSWTEGPRIDEPALADLCARLSTHFQQADQPD